MKVYDDVPTVRQLIVLLKCKLFVFELQSCQFDFLLFEGMVVDVGLMVQLLVFVEETVNKIKVKLLSLLQITVEVLGSLNDSTGWLSRSSGYLFTRSKTSSRRMLASSIKG